MSPPLAEQHSEQQQNSNAFWPVEIQSQQKMKEGSNIGCCNFHHYVQLGPIDIYINTINIFAHLRTNLLVVEQIKNASHRLSNAIKIEDLLTKKARLNSINGPTLPNIDIDTVVNVNEFF